MITATLERDAFLRAIADAPDDDAPRLVFADWLDEHGEPERAEFIRAQCAAETWPEGHPARTRLEERADDLLAEHRSRWEAGLPAGPHGHRRGFLDVVTVPGSECVARLPQLADVLPPVRLAIGEASASVMNALADLPEWAAVRRVELSDGTQQLLNHAALVQLVTSGHLTELELSLFGSGLETVGSELANWPGLARLRTLRLSGSFGSQFAARMLASRHLTNVRELQLLNTEPGRLHLADALVEWPGFRRLERLSLWQTTDEVLRTLLQRGQPHALRDLSVVGSEVSPSVTLELLASAQLPALRRLSVDGYLAETPARVDHLPEPVGNLASLESLSMRGIFLGDDGVAWLARLPRLGELTTLELWQCGLGSTGVQALAQSPSLSRLRRLNLGLNNLGADGWRALAESPHLAELIALELPVTQPTVRGIQALRRATWARSLVELDLTGNQLSRTAVQALRTVPFDSLRRIRLGYRPIDWNEFREGDWFERLESIHLGGTLGNAHLKRLVGLMGPALRSLQARDGQFGAAGLKALTARDLPGLRRLDLRGSRIGAAGLRVLADWPGLTRLNYLSLRDTGISTAVLRALADSPYLSRSCTLVVGSSAVSTVLDALRERVGLLIVE